MRKTLRLIPLLLLASGVAQADSGLVTKKSAYGVSETLDRLEAVLEQKGLTIFARVNHSEGAAKAQMTLRPTELLIFGNPKMGTPLMHSNPTAGIDLPMKVLAWQDAQGQVWIAYNRPSYLATRHAINDRTDIVNKMTGALAKLTDKAISKP